MKHTSRVLISMAAATALLTALASCGGMLVSTEVGASSGYDPYYYDGWPGNWYGQIVNTPMPLWNGIGWNPGLRPVMPPASIPPRPSNPDGPQHFIPAQPPQGGGSLVSPPQQNGEGLTGQRPAAGRH